MISNPRVSERWNEMIMEIKMRPEYPQRSATAMAADAEASRAIVNWTSA